MVADPRTGLRFYDLSHTWGHGTPVWPGFPASTFERGIQWPLRVETRHNAPHRFATG